MSKHYFTTCKADLYPFFAYLLQERKQAYEITIFVSVWMCYISTFKPDNQFSGNLL